MGTGCFVAEYPLKLFKVKTKMGLSAVVSSSRKREINLTDSVNSCSWLSDFLDCNGSNRETVKSLQRGHNVLCVMRLLEF